MRLWFGRGGYTLLKAKLFLYMVFYMVWKPAYKQNLINCLKSDLLTL